MAETQTWNADSYLKNAHFVPALGAPVVELLDPQLSERILDLGCGDGTLTLSLASKCREVVGIDASSAMIETAKARGLDARLMDARALDFDCEFDAVFSSAVLHWVKDDPDAPIAGAFRALRPGGRFVGEMGGHACVAAIQTALLAVAERRGVANAAGLIPWYFPTAAEYTARLTRAGFEVRPVQWIHRPTPLPTGMRGWLETFANPFCAAIPASDRSAFLDDVTALLKPVLCDGDGNWTADYTRIRFAAFKPL